MVVSGTPDPNWLGSSGLMSTTDGNDFWFTFMAHNAVETTDPSLNLTVIAVAEEELTITVELNGSPAGTISIPAGGGEGKLTKLNPAVAYVNAGECEQTLPNRAIHVYSNNPQIPFSCYAFAEAGNGQNTTRDASLVLPTHMLGKNYYVQTFQTDTRATEFAVIITEDHTDLTIIPKVKTSLGSPAGTPIEEKDLSKGTVYLVRSIHPSEVPAGESIDLSGSSVCATKPVAVFQGNEAVKIATGSVGSYSVNHAFEQTLPITQWGKEYYLGLTANSQTNYYNILAAYNDTKVTISGITDPVMLSAGQTLDEANQLFEGNENVKITSDKPILVNSYLSCGGENQVSTIVGGKRVTYNWGNSTSAMIPAWESRVKHMSFYTDTISNETATGVGHMYVQVITKTSDINTFTLDANAVPSSSFVAMTNTPSMSVANIELTEDSLHTLETTGDGFVGFVYSMTSEARAYQYTLGFAAKSFRDSLYIENSDAFMIGGYNLDYVSGKGWYQRQPNEWINARLDTAEICDSTTLNWRIESPADTLFRVDSIHWIISAQGETVEIKDTVIQNGDLVHRWKYQFTIPQEVKDERITSLDFNVQALLYHKPAFCEEKAPIDTLQGVVRVLTIFNDTTWKTICMGDTVTFFGETDKTKFIATTTGTPKTGEKFVGLGTYSETRRYTSIGGCDSLSTIMIYVCPSYLDPKDTVVCENGTSGLDYGEFFAKFKADNSWPVGVDTLMRDTLLAKGCMDDPEWDLFRPHCSDFKGCDSILELHLNVKKRYEHTQTVPKCVATGTIYVWKDEASGQEIDRFSADTMTKNVQYVFFDTIRYSPCTGCPKGGCDSVINELRLTFFSNEGQQHTIHVCQGNDSLYKNLESSYYFDSNGKICNTPYVHNLNVEVKDESGNVQCEFIDKLTFYVDTVYKDTTYATICWDPDATDQTYSWANHPEYSAVPVTGPGLFTYVDTLKQDTCDCDSICVLSLRVGQPYLFPTVEEICDNDSVTWQDTLFYGINYKGPLPPISKQVTGSHYASVKKMKSQYLCDSVMTFSLDIHPTYLLDWKDTAICANEVYHFFGKDYNTPGDPWAPSATPYEIADTLPTDLYGCDSVIRHRVTVHPVYLDQRETNDTVCQVLDGEAYYEWAGADHASWNSRKLQSLNEAGTFELVDSMETVHNCDSVIKRTLVIMPSYFQPFARIMSSEDTVHWENRIYAGQEAVFDNPLGWPVTRCTGTKIITDSLLTEQIGNHSCDSVRRLTLRIGQVFRDTVYDATCANCAPYEWVITSPITGLPTTIPITDLPAPYQERIYYDSLITDLGFDSIYVLRLTAYPNYNYSDVDQVCQGEVYTWSGHMAGDNGVTHRLFKDGSPITEIPTSTPGVIYVTDSMQVDTVFTNPKTGLPKPMHCDSVHVLTLTIHPTYNSRNTPLVDPQTMSSNDTLVHFVEPRTLFVGYDFDFDAAGITKTDFKNRYDTVIYITRTGQEVWRDSAVNTSVHGCDSTRYVEISICQVQYTDLTDSIGDNDSVWVFGGDATPDASGNREHTLPFVYGRDFNVDDNGDPIDYSSLDRTIRIKEFIDTLHTAEGCDSIVHMTLSIFPSYLFIEEETICGNNGKYKWHEKTNLNKLIGDNETGLVYVYDSLTTTLSGNIVDSVYILKLTILPGELSYTSKSICYNETVLWHGLPLQYDPDEPATEVVHIFQDEDSECGREIHMTPIWNPAYGYSGDPEYNDWVETIHICQYDDFHWLDANGKEHTLNLRDPEGNKYTSIPTDRVGDFILYDSLTTVGCKCDSIFTLRFRVDTTYRYDTEEYLCTGETYDWFVNGSLYKTYSLHTVGDIFDTIKNETALGCDSSYYLHLRVDSTYHIFIDETLCPTETKTFEWNNRSYEPELTAAHQWDAPQQFYDTIREKTFIAGCDSIRYLHLTILPAKDSVWSDTICESESYLFFDTTLTTSGTYVETRPNRWGCTIDYRFTLLVIEPTQYTVATEPLCIDPATTNSFPLYYAYNDGFAPVVYSIYYDSLAKKAGFENLLQIPVPDNGQTVSVEGSDHYVLDIEVPYFEQLSYPTPGHYSATIGFENGICEGDTLMRFPFTFTIDYPSWIMEQRHSDLIALLNEDYNGGYTWTEYQWYEGDSLLVGQTKPYLYIPTGLTVGAEYHVDLTRNGEKESFPACPLIVKPATGTTPSVTPTIPYLAVTPTCVVIAHPYINILSKKEGTYRVTTTAGRTVTEGTFQPEVTVVQLPETEGLYIVQLWSKDTPEEPYRAIKVIVRQECPNCDISSF